MDDIALWLNLLRVPKLGAVQINQLYLQGELPALCSRAVAGSSSIRFSSEQLAVLKQPNHPFIDDVLRWCEHHQVAIISLASPYYPELLKAIVDPPPVLFVQGDPVLLDKPQLAIVGSRNASPTGRAIAHQIAAEVAATGYVVTSGLALGIDGCAHQGALSTGKTFAVLGSGLGRLYPKRHQALAEQILAAGGLLISELVPQTAPQAFHFPRRNRIISGLSEGVLVVEASVKSGSLITARLAAEQGREVFAVPGALGNPESRGCHLLIKEGAGLVESIEDIFVVKDLNCISQSPYREQIPQPQGLPNSLLLDNVRDNATSVDELVQKTGIAVEEVLSELLELEVQGWVASVPGGYIRLRGS